MPSKQEVDQQEEEKIMEGLPDEIRVMCNTTPGIYSVKKKEMKCLCSYCATAFQDGVTMTPTEFERHCGMAKYKKWTQSVKVLDGTLEPYSIGKWFCKKGLMSLGQSYLRMRQGRTKKSQSKLKKQDQNQIPDPVPLQYVSLDEDLKSSKQNKKTIDWTPKGTTVVEDDEATKSQTDPAYSAKRRQSENNDCNLNKFIWTASEEEQKQPLTQKCQNSIKQSPVPFKVLVLLDNLSKVLLDVNDTVHGAGYLLVGLQKVMGGLLFLRAASEKTNYIVSDTPLNIQLIQELFPVSLLNSLSSAIASIVNNNLCATFQSLMELLPKLLYMLYSWHNQAWPYQIVHVSNGCKRRLVKLLEDTVDDIQVPADQERLMESTTDALCPQLNNLEIPSFQQLQEILVQINQIGGDLDGQNPAQDLVQVLVQFLEQQQSTSSHQFDVLPSVEQSMNESGSSHQLQQTLLQLLLLMNDQTQQCTTASQPYTAPELRKAGNSLPPTEQVLSNTNFGGTEQDCVQITQVQRQNDAVSLQVTIDGVTFQGSLPQIRTAPKQQAQTQCKEFLAGHKRYVSETVQLCKPASLDAKCQQSQATKGLAASLVDLVNMSTNNKSLHSSNGHSTSCDGACGGSNKRLCTAGSRTFYLPPQSADFIQSIHSRTQIDSNVSNNDERPTDILLKLLLQASQQPNSTISQLLQQSEASQPNQSAVDACYSSAGSLSNQQSTLNWDLVMQLLQQSSSPGINLNNI